MLYAETERPYQSTNQSVYYAQGSTIEHGKTNEYKMKTYR